MNRIRSTLMAGAAVVNCLPGAVLAQDEPADTVRVGSPALHGAVLTEGTYVLANYRQTDGVDTRQSTTTQTFERKRVGDVDTWVISTMHVSPDTTRTQLVIRADDLSFVHQRVKGALDSTAVSASRDYLTGWVHLHEQEPVLLDRALDHAVFPVEGQVPWLLPLLPFADGYSATIEYFSPWSAGMVSKTVRVVGTESIEVGERAFDTWKIDAGRLFADYTVTYWVDRTTRRIVRGVASRAGDGPVFWSEIQR